DISPEVAMTEETRSPHSTTLLATRMDDACSRTTCSGGTLQCIPNASPRAGVSGERTCVRLEARGENDSRAPHSAPSLLPPRNTLAISFATIHLCTAGAIASP